MDLKSTYKLTYTLDKELKELIVVVELILRDGFKQPFQNVYCGYATVNGHSYEEEDLSSCVNPQTTAERIGQKHRDQLIAKYKKSEHKFKIKKEELK